MPIRPAGACSTGLGGVVAMRAVRLHCPHRTQSAVGREQVRRSTARSSSMSPHGNRSIGFVWLVCRDADARAAMVASHSGPGIPHGRGCPGGVTGTDTLRTSPSMPGPRIEFAPLTVGGGCHTVAACRSILAPEVGDGCRRRGSAQALHGGGVSPDGGDRDSRRDRACRVDRGRDRPDGAHRSPACRLRDQRHAAVHHQARRSGGRLAAEPRGHPTPVRAAAGSAPAPAAGGLLQPGASSLPGRLGRGRGGRHYGPLRSARQGAPLRPGASRSSGFAWRWTAPSRCIANLPTTAMAS